MHSTCLQLSDGTLRITLTIKQTTMKKIKEGDVVMFLLHCSALATFVNILLWYYKDQSYVWFIIDFACILLCAIWYRKWLKKHKG